jgi:hypothetical protein
MLFQVVHAAPISLCPEFWQVRWLLIFFLHDRFRGLADQRHPLLV